MIMVNALLGTFPSDYFCNFDGIILRSDRILRFTPKTFHELCDARGPTVVIIKPAQSNNLISGYNPIDWHDDGGGLCPLIKK